MCAKSFQSEGPDKFKCKDLLVALLLLQKGDFLFKFDLKSGQHYIDIYMSTNRRTWALLAEWKVKQVILFFGLSSTCYAFA